MKITNSVLLILMTLFLSACGTTYYVTSDYAEGNNFQSYQSYNYMHHDHNFPLGANSINKQRIEAAIAREFNALGQVESETPDLLVSWFIIVEQVEDFHYYQQYYSRWLSLYIKEPYEYTKGTLVIDIIDKEQNKVVWHGKTSEQVYEGMPNVDKKIKRAVRAIFKQYAKDAKLGGLDYAMNTIQN